MRITYISSFAHRNAVGAYRVQHPLAALQALGHECRLLLLGDEPERVSNAELAGDLLILQRQHGTGAIDLIDTLPPAHRPRVVYEMDDNPFEWHSWDPSHRALGARQARDVRAVLARCHAVTCSTLALAERIRRECPSLPLWVIPNAIDYQIRDWEAAEERAAHGLAERIVLGWTGSVHHQQDGHALLQALPEVFRRWPETVFLMQCDRSVYQAWTTTLQDGWGDRLRWAPPVPFDLHPRVYSLFDINLAPLQNTAFNVCKSDLRLIEGGAHGVPYVASDLAPYRELHHQSGGIGGYLAATPGDWVAGIGKLIQREDVARGQSLARYVRETRALAVVAGQWETAYRSVLAGAPGAAVATRLRPERNSLCPCDSGRKYKRCCEPAYG